MEIKKTPRANLEKEITLSYLMGVVVALAVLFVGFEWGSSDIEVATSSATAVVIDEEEIEITVQDESIPEPPAPEPIVEVLPEIINIVENNVEVEAIEFASTEDDLSTAQVATYTAAAVVEEDEEEVDENYIFVSVEVPPEFPGGQNALLLWIRDNMKYPPVAAENGISGIVNCQFTVNADGSVTDVEVVRGRDANLDREALRVLKLVPKFKPGQQGGKPVRVKYNVPVRFVLQ